MHRGLFLYPLLDSQTVPGFPVSATTQKELVLGLENLQIGYILQPRHTQSESVFFSCSLPSPTAQNSPIPTCSSCYVINPAESLCQAGSIQGCPRGLRT